MTATITIKDIDDVGGISVDCEFDFPVDDTTKSVAAWLANELLAHAATLAGE